MCYLSSLQFGLHPISPSFLKIRAQIKSALKKRLHEQEASSQNVKKTKEKTQAPSNEPQAKKRKTEGMNSSNFISICLVSTSPITSVYMNSYLHTGSVWLKLKPAGNDHITSQK